MELKTIVWGVLALCVGWALPAQAAPGKKIVFIAGTKSHGPGEHEYEKGLRLLAKCLETSPNLSGYRTEVHLYGWPEDPKTLDDADTIVLYADGSDHNESDHPLLVGDHLATIGRQMKRGCGLVLLHYATFAPVKRGGPEYLDWVGGYFDYETGEAANHWYSKIQTASATPFPATPNHPICRGLTPFPLTEEFYYRMKFRDNDSRRVPILNAALPGEAEPQTVAWAVQRTNGGRGFAFTGGHAHSNWKIENFRRMVLNAIVWTAKGNVPAGGVQSSVAPDQDAIRALVLTGHHHPGHDWRATTQALQEILARDNRMQVTVWEDPEKLATESLANVDLLIQNYDNWESPTLSAKSRENLLKFVQGGGGLELIHFANGAWRDWPDYFGRMARRVWIDGKSNHDAYEPFRVHIAKSDSRLTQGLPDFDTMDELYCSQQGDLPVDPLLTAHSKTTDRDEPLAFVYTEGRGRIFQTLLGHGAEGLRVPAHAELIRRATAWIAHREVLPQPVPASAGGVIAAQAKPPVRTTGPRVQPGRSGNALFPGGATFAAEGRALYQEPPLTVECFAKLTSHDTFNILVANSAKESQKHWELYTEAGTGRFSVYLPGATPQNIVAPVDITDGQWHYVAMTYLPGRVRLFVDGKVATDQQIGSSHATAIVGPLWFGAYPPGALGCDGLIDEVRISNVIRDITQTPTAPLALDTNTIGLWRFDALENGKFADLSPTKNPAMNRAQVVATVEEPTILGAFPVVRKRDTVDWANVGNDKGGMRYSTLKQIDRTSVKNLKIAWTYHTGDAAAEGTTIECTPIVIEGVMYLTTVRTKIVALDAATGHEIWKFDPHTGGVNRGVGYWSDGKPGGERRILSALNDGRLLCLDAKTGRLDPHFGTGGIVDMRQGIEYDISHMGYGSTSAPAIFGDLVMVGVIVAEGQPGAPGDIRAWNIRTGKEVWRFHTVPRPGEFGNETWAGDSWKERSGVNPWSGFTVDEKNGLLLCGTGSAASDFYGADRHGDNLFANCTLVLDARTGKRVWHFQTTHHDLWDHDNPCPPVVVTVKHNGRMVEAVAQPTKTGYIFLFDRKTGKPLFDVQEVAAPPSDIPGEQASPTQPVPVKPPALAPQVFGEEDVTNLSPEAHAFVLDRLHGLRYGKAYIPPSVQGSVITPGFHGGANWSGASFDPTSGYLYININNVPYVCGLKPNTSGGYDFQGYNYFNDAQGYPAIKPPWGMLYAVNLNTGEIAWKTVLGAFPALTALGIPPTGTENFGGTIVTAGGLVFIGGTKDEKFHAFDKATGSLLWDYKLNTGGYATPSTYMVNGKQYVVIACGGGGKLRTKSGDEFVAFALP